MHHVSLGSTVETKHEAVQNDPTCWDWRCCASPPWFKAAGSLTRATWIMMEIITDGCWVLRTFQEVGVTVKTSRIDRFRITFQWNGPVDFWVVSSTVLEIAEMKWTLRPVPFGFQLDLLCIYASIHICTVTRWISGGGRYIGNPGDVKSFLRVEFVMILDYCDWCRDSTVDPILKLWIFELLYIQSSMQWCARVLRL